MYYGSNNYGGLLQSYCLCKYLNDLGYDAEQICFKTNQMFEDDAISNQSPSLLRKVKRFLMRSVSKKIAARKDKIKTFREDCIPHSEVLYTENNLSECNNNYDAFVTGSDQVWNMNWYEHAYFLDFVNEEKSKISYAASIGMEELSDEQKATINDKLKDFKAISVRERRAVELIKECTNNPVVQVLDPTLLFEKEDWDELSSERIVNSKYLFCYFLGKREDTRKLAKEYARKHSLKIVTIQYVSGCFRKCDAFFGDIKLYEVDPRDFVSLIKYADCVITDSFHAGVLSNIYDKNFFVFQRYASGKMSSRITSLLELFGNSDRFCDVKEKESLEYIEGVNSMMHSSDRKTIEQEQKTAYNFLENALR